MTNQEILTKLAEAKKGRYINLTKAKDLGQGIVKESDMVIRLGVAYSNMKINEDRQTGQLPWGRWVEGLENLVIEHKGNFICVLVQQIQQIQKVALMLLQRVT